MSLPFSVLSQEEEDRSALGQSSFEITSETPAWIEEIEEPSNLRAQGAELSIALQKESISVDRLAMRASWLSTLVAMIAASLLLWTLLLTRQANAAAREAVEVTRKASIDQSRAYIHVDAATITWGNKFGEHPEVTLTAINSGQTPAKWFEIISVCSARELNDKNSLHSTEIFIQRKATRWNAFPANDEQTMPGIQTQKDFDALKGSYAKKDILISISGKIRYCTFYDEIFESDFLFEHANTPKYREISREIIGTELAPHGVPINVVETDEQSHRIPKSPSHDIRTFVRL
ncbi:hypothetical protein ACMA5I_08425 [Paracoccaceae bacterium GXU_MW_L88]